MTLGVIRRVRSTITGQDPAFGYSGKWYERGKLVGEVHSFVLGFISPCGLGAVAKLSHRAINAVQAVGGLANARDNVRAGNYGAAALDLVGVSGNLASFLRACFSGDMLVLTRERGAVRWDDLHVGEEVWSQDEFDPNAPPTWKRVEEIFQTEAFICTLRVAGQEIKTTGEHPFWVQGKGWTPVNELHPGDKLRGVDGQLYPVEAVTATDEWLPVYNARIADYHTYYVCAPDGNVWLWAHNACSRTNAYKKELFERAGKPKSASAVRAAFQELRGKQISLAIQRGVAYDHVRKVQNAQRGLVYHIQRLKRQLGSNDLTPAQRQALEKELSKASKLLDMTERFVPRIP